MSEDEQPAPAEGPVRPDALDVQRFAHAVRRLRGRLTLWISVRMGPALRARLAEEDVLQETFLEAYRSLERFQDSDEEAMARWLMAIAENRLRDLAKRHGAQRRAVRRETPLHGGGDDDPGPIARLVVAMTSPGGRARRHELARRLAACMDRLPEELRDIVVWHAVEGQTFKDIAGRLHRRPQTVSALYVEALERLRHELGPAFTF